MKNFLYRIKSKVLNIPQKWDSLSPSKEEAREFANKYINSEIPRYRDKQPTLEYILVSSGETIASRLRSGEVTQQALDIYELVKKYKISKEIVVYRGVSEPVYNSMIKSVNGEKDFDFKEEAFLHTSLVKGFEARDPYKRLRIKLPKGTNAFYAGDINGEENFYYEVVVQKGARLKIVSIDDYINCELIGTE